jgi:PadR family transcriptional regulator, regulatory protein PadR
MAKTRNDNLQGALTLLVLKSLEQGPMHGWGITLHIQQISNDVLRVEEGSIYPALHRMEQDRWIASEWGTSENNRRARFYRLTTRPEAVKCRAGKLAEDYQCGRPGPERRKGVDRGGSHGMAISHARIFCKRETGKRT